MNGTVVPVGALFRGGQPLHCYRVDARFRTRVDIEGNVDAIFPLIVAGRNVREKPPLLAMQHCETERIALHLQRIQAEVGCLPNQLEDQRGLFIDDQRGHVDRIQLRITNKRDVLHALRVRTAAGARRLGLRSRGLSGSAQGKNETNRAQSATNPSGHEASNLAGHPVLRHRNFFAAAGFTDSGAMPATQTETPAPKRCCAPSHPME